jgi:hypothetical protein
MQFKDTKVVRPNGEELVIKVSVEPVNDRGSKLSICPVCGNIACSRLPPWSMGTRRDPVTHKEFGEPVALPSYDICPSCQTQYGEDDTTRAESVTAAWEELRREWLDSQKWSAEALKQLKDNLGVIPKR